MEREAAAAGLRLADLHASQNGRAVESSQSDRSGRAVRKKGGANWNAVIDQEEARRAASNLHHQPVITPGPAKSSIRAALQHPRRIRSSAGNCEHVTWGERTLTYPSRSSSLRTKLEGRF